MATNIPRDRIIIRTMRGGPYYSPGLDQWIWTYHRKETKATDIQIVKGVGDFVFFNQAPDVGHVIIKSKNREFDPLTNQYISAGRALNVEYMDLPDTSQPEEYLRPLFRGVIKDVTVKYNPMNEPEITVTGIDNVGLLAAHEISQEFANRPDVNGVELTLKELFEKLPDDISLGYIDPELSPVLSTNEPRSPLQYVDGQKALGPDDVNYNEYTLQSHNGVWGPSELLEMGQFINKPMAKTYVKAGDNAYDLITRLAQADLTEITCNAENIVYAQPHFKWHPLFWLAAGKEIQRANSPEGPTNDNRQFNYVDMNNRPYFNVTASDGEQRMINHIVFSNTSRDASGNETVTEYGPFVDQASINQYGQKAIIIDTLRNNDGNLNSYFTMIADEILRIAKTPKPRINSFQTDMTKKIDRDLVNPITASNLGYTNRRLWLEEIRDPDPLGIGDLYGSVTSSASGTYIDKTTIDMSFNTNPQDPENGIIIGGGSETIGVKHFLNGSNWTTEILLSNDSKEKQLQENIDYNLPGVMKASGDPTLQGVSGPGTWLGSYTVLKLFKYSGDTEGPINDGDPSDMQASDFDNVTNWWWVHGNNGKERDDTSLMFASTDPALDGTRTHTWKSAAQYPDGNLGFLQYNGYQNYAGRWEQPETLYLKDNNGWMYIYADKEYYESQ